MFGTQTGRVWDQITHFNTSGTLRRTGLHFLADGIAFFAVGADEFVVELEVHPQAGGDGEEVSSFQFSAAQRRASSAWDRLDSSSVSRCFGSGCAFQHLCHFTLLSYFPANPPYRITGLSFARGWRRSAKSASFA